MSSQFCSMTTEAMLEISLQLLRTSSTNIPTDALACLSNLCDRRLAIILNRCQDDVPSVQRRRDFMMQAGDLARESLVAFETVLKQHDLNDVADML